LTRSETQKLLDNISQTYPKIVEELIPEHLTLGGVQRVLQNLLKERIPIRDIITVIDTLLDYSGKTKDPEVLTEFVRQTLSRTITRQYIDDKGKLPVFTLDPAYENMITQAQSGSINPDIVNGLARSIESILTSGMLRGTQLVILCSSNVRRYLRRIVEGISSSIVVLSSAEIIPSTNLDIRGMVKYEN
jgi:flagellar biosynthesis protein FlhA